MGDYTVIRTHAFDLLAADYAREHPKLKEDLDWLGGRLAEAPQLMGDHVPELGRLALPIHHKKEYENPGARFLLQKLERAFASRAKPKPEA